MRISDWSSDVCSSDLIVVFGAAITLAADSDQCDILQAGRLPEACNCIAHLRIEFGGRDAVGVEQKGPARQSAPLDYSSGFLLIRAGFMHLKRDRKRVG